MSFVLPGFLHVIARRDFLYFTLHVFGRRLHFCRPELPAWVSWKSEDFG